MLDLRRAAPAVCVVSGGERIRFASHINHAIYARENGYDYRLQIGLTERAQNGYFQSNAMRSQAGWYRTVTSQSLISKGDTVAIDGSWKGKLNGSGDATFEAYVEIDTLREGSVSGTVYYPGIDDAGACSGALIYRGRSGSDYLFTEDIVARADPDCIKLGQVRVGSAEDGKAITYSWKAGQNTAVGTLQEWDD